MNPNGYVKVGGQHFRTIWLHPANERVVQLIDQRFLPHRFVIEEVSTVAQMATAIREMHVRGAGLIGASAGYGMYLATIEAAGSPAVAGFDQHVVNAAAQLKATRPTAVNLTWAIEWQLTSIAESAGGHLMQRGAVDLVIVGSDRTTCTGDVANKIGTYLKALAAQDNEVPFYVALPSSSFDWTIRDGSEIPIEERGAEELKRADGWRDGQILGVSVAPEDSPAANYGFDVTPRRLVTGLITERGVCKADEKSILELFAEHAS